jgi:hypothetical protein
MQYHIYCNILKLYQSCILMFCAQIYFSHNSIPVHYLYTIVLLYLLLLYTMQYVLLIDMTEYATPMASFVSISCRFQ